MKIASSAGASPLGCSTAALTIAMRCAVAWLLVDVSSCASFRAELLVPTHYCCCFLDTACAWRAVALDKNCCHGNLRNWFLWSMPAAYSLKSVTTVIEGSVSGLSWGIPTWANFIFFWLVKALFPFLCVRHPWSPLPNAHCWRTPLFLISRRLYV